MIGVGRNYFDFVDFHLTLGIFLSYFLSRIDHNTTQSILEALQFLFVKSMPANFTKENSLKFLQKIFALAQGALSNEIAREKNNRFFSPALHFLDGFVEMHGNTIETMVLLKQSNRDETPSEIGSTEQDKKIYDCLDSLARETIRAMTSQNLLGSAWTSVKATQGNGQSAFESKSKQPVIVKPADFCSSGLAPFFSFLSTCTKHCPAFLLHVLASREPEGDDDTNDAPDLTVLRKAMNSAVSSILDVESDISIRAIAFLESVVSLAASDTATDNENNAIATNNNSIRRVAGQYNLSFQTNMLSVLLRGTCGMLQHFVLPHALRLLFHTLSKSFLSEEEFKVIVLRGLSQEHFFLGKRARGVIYEFCLLLLRRSNTDITNNVDDSSTAPSRDRFDDMMTDVWRLHRFENVDAIERSDAVHEFVIRFGRKNLATTS